MTKSIYQEKFIKAFYGIIQNLDQEKDQASSTPWACPWLYQDIDYFYNVTGNPTTDGELWAEECQNEINQMLAMEVEEE